MGYLGVSILAAFFAVSAHATLDIIENGLDKIACDITGKVRLLTSADLTDGLCICIWCRLLPAGMRKNADVVLHDGTTPNLVERSRCNSAV